MNEETMYAEPKKKKGDWKIKFVGFNDYIINNYHNKEVNQETLMIERIDDARRGDDEEDTIETFDLHAAIERLSEKDQKLINDYYFHGKTYEDLAASLGCSKQNVHQKMRRIVKSMKPK